MADKNLHAVAVADQFPLRVQPGIQRLGGECCGSKQQKKTLPAAAAFCDGFLAGSE